MDELNSTNMFSPAELLTTGTAQLDDAPRVAMVSTQSKHIVPAIGYNRLLVGNGSDKVLGRIIGNDFAFKAKEDGQVVEVDDEAGVIVIKYKSGKIDVIETDSKVVKNGGAGFYIVNKLTPYVKQGDKFKADDILAANEDFFNYDKSDSEIMHKSGVLAKTAISSAYFTYEDACAVTEKLSKKMTSFITMKQDIILGPNSNIEFIVKKGDTVEVGDPLLIYDQSYDDEGLNKMLSALSKEDADEFNTLAKKPIKAHYSGVIEDIKVIFTVDKKDMSPSLAKTVNNINKELNKKLKTIEKYVDIRETDVIMSTTEKVETHYGKVKGVEVGDGVYIEFYIKYEDKMGVGDKLTYFTALKGIDSENIPVGLEAYSEYRPEEEISAFLSPISVYSRMTGSVFTNLFTNKILIELGRQIIDIYEKDTGKKK